MDCIAIYDTNMKDVFIEEIEIDQWIMANSKRQLKKKGN